MENTNDHVPPSTAPAPAGPAASPLPGEFGKLGAETFGGASFWQVGVDQNLQKCWYKGTKWNNNHQTWGYWPIKPTYYIPYVGGWISILIGNQRLSGGWKPKVPGFWLTPRLATCLKMCGTLSQKNLLKQKMVGIPHFQTQVGSQLPKLLHTCSGQQFEEPASIGDVMHDHCWVFSSDSTWCNIDIVKAAQNTQIQQKSQV